ncbi:signal recognition particle receptor subunit beta isoform X1 [Ambystoma mexicanum]|uniref:signal recognition particle receptor subunit beta isoform X1 n=1 Tax=Ambystoma mexicanum TaxID=8296 RepID=UPI0037E82F3D
MGFEGDEVGPGPRENDGDSTHRQEAGSVLLDFQPYVENLKRELAGQDPVLISVLVALLVVILSMVLWKVVRGRKSSRRAVLLVGLCDSGKTLLFSRLLTGKFKLTQTSITDSTAVYRVKNDKTYRLNNVGASMQPCRSPLGILISESTSLTLIDLPGHESLRLQFLDRFKAAARAIVFVVDSSTFQREVKDVAELLYQLLTDSEVLKNSPPLLVACNKQDITMAKSAKLIQHQLEKELNTLRVTRTAAPSNLDSSNADGAAQLGKKGKDFDFSQLPMKVEFLECSCRDSKEEEGDANLSNLEKWLVKMS